jgi:DNA repair protein RadD
MSIQLRDYQVRALQSTRDTMATQRKRRIVIYSPTGSGKTVLGMAMIKGAMAKGKRIAFIANRIGLVKQASEQLSRAGIDHGIIQGQNTDGVHKPCVVCSIQTLARRGFPDCDVFVIDEAHGVPGSKDYRELIFRNSNQIIIGLTATPFAKGMAKKYPELNGEPLFDGMTIAATIRELIEQGFLVDCDIYAPADPDLTGVKTKKNEFGERDYVDSDLGKAMDKKELIGDIVKNWRQIGNDKPTVVFASSIAHSKHIVEQFMSNGVKAEHIDCYTSEEDRAGIMRRVSEHDTRVISNVGILTEGWDFPACEVMVLARPTKSLTRWIQMVGRILRPSNGKTRGIVIDHSGSTLHLGYPTDDLPLELDDGRPAKSGVSEKEEKKPKKCPKCSFMKPAGKHVCPKCGFAPEARSDVETIDGKLELVKRCKVPRSDKQDTYSQLLTVQRNRGYSPGWVANQFRSKFGVWPKGLDNIQKPVTQDILNWIKHQQIRYAKSKERANAA